jgi:SpoVK/Ycf46/Vps4 family AAA+-type ATPase
MIDEIEKAFAGINGQGDSGVSTRMFGTVLTWLNDHSSDVFVVCTSNDISRLPPEFSRAERFDAVFFVDLPGRVQKDSIWSLYRDQFGIDKSETQPADENWTGAEIRSCCRLAALLDLPLVQAAQNVVPVATTSSEAIVKLRTWASGRCLSADAGGIYGTTEASSKITASSGRRVRRNGPSLN